jgi:Ca2+-binding RTX toxin-like protein
LGANDTILGGPDWKADFISGGSGNDKLYGRGGNDAVETGSEMVPGGTVLHSAHLAGGLHGDAGNDFINGGSNSDLLDGGAGDDTLAGASENDCFFEEIDRSEVDIFSRVEGGLHGGDGNDKLHGGDGTDLLEGDAGQDLLRGGAGDDRSSGDLGGEYGVRYIAGLRGGAGDDRLYGEAGRDDVDGGTGNDLLVGGAGADTLTGGAGADRFRFTRPSESGPAADDRDTITDFRGVSGDRIDLWAIDADRDTGGNQAFRFIGTSAFHGVDGELRYQRVGGDVVVSGDTNGDRAADFSILLTDLTTLAAGDFML